MTRPSTQYLARAYMADLITDARTSYRYARDLERGGTGYGSTAADYRAAADALRAEYRTLRSATRYHVGTYGEVTAQ